MYSINAQLYKVSLVPALALIALASAQAQKPTWILKVLNKTKPQVDKILGKPVKFNKEDGSAIYKMKGFSSIGVAYYGKGGRSLAVEIEFAQTTSAWQDALKKVGLSSSKVNPTRTPANNGWDLTGVAGLPKGWQATFLEAGETDDGETKTPYPSKLSIYSADSP